MEVRLFFKKIGNIRYISHLDLQRAMIRILIRSGLDITFSEGFNPHPRMAFAVPLSIYQESEYEIFDFKLNQETPFDEIKDKLSKGMPQGLDIIRVAEPKSKISSCYTARYRLTITTAKSADEIKELLSGDITILKKTKTKELLCDIATQITNRIFYEHDGKVIMEVTLPAENNNYLNPNYIAEFLKDSIDYCFIRRLCLYDINGKPME
ncbi:MAG: hypothetical protein A2Y15_07300 [Clostridiales bacterium GWF2_36_10]|nr:MAG: hypothetical protein A2Y15_07300 [Clostridiales bacterium GWF2_36_10]HAN21308.1 hypothetical protein [Clostridiales bacterium]